jgi:hypothetical protein
MPSNNQNDSSNIPLLEKFVNILNKDLKYKNFKKLNEDIAFSPYKDDN